VNDNFTVVLRTYSSDQHKSDDEDDVQAEKGRWVPRNLLNADSLSEGALDKSHLPSYISQMKRKKASDLKRVTPDFSLLSSTSNIGASARQGQGQPSSDSGSLVSYEESGNMLKSSASLTRSDSDSSDVEDDGKGAEEGQNSLNVWGRIKRKLRAASSFKRLSINPYEVPAYRYVKPLC